MTGPVTGGPATERGSLNGEVEALRTAIGESLRLMGKVADVPGYIGRAEELLSTALAASYKRASRAAAEGDAGALRAALTDANSIIAMTRRHLAEDHPDCAYTALGVMNDASRAALAAASPEPLDALLTDLSVMASSTRPWSDWTEKSIQDALAAWNARLATAATPAAGEPGE